MAARGPLTIVAPLLFVGLAGGFVAVYFFHHATPPPTPPTATNDPRAGQIAASIQAADDAEKAGQWELARKALERALALDPANATVKGRLEQAVEEEKRAKIMVEADEAKKSGDAAKEAAKLEEARRIREDKEDRSRQAAAELEAAVKRALAAEKDGFVPLAIESWRGVKVAAAKQEAKDWFAAHPDKALADAAPEAVDKKLAALQALLDEGDAAARKKAAADTAALGAAAQKEARITTAIAKYKEAIAGDGANHPEWTKALELALEYDANSQKALDAGLKAFEAQDWKAAKESLLGALRWNKECANAAKLLPQVVAQSTRKGMIPVPAATVMVNGQGVGVRAFYIEPAEVTEAQYCEFLKANKLPLPARWTDGKPPADGALPMMGISAIEAEAYAASLGRRLPTEAEWLSAGGASDGRKYPWGAEWDPAKANAKSPGPWVGGTHPAGASPCGALDMAGNVAEWTSSTDGGKRVIKGGCFLFSETSCELTWRDLEDEDLGLPGIGFRCAANGDEKE